MAPPQQQRPPTALKRRHSPPTHRTRQHLVRANRARNFWRVAVVNVGGSEREASADGRGVEGLRLPAGGLARLVDELAAGGVEGEEGGGGGAGVCEGYEVVGALGSVDGVAGVVGGVEVELGGGRGGGEGGFVLYGFDGLGGVKF